MKAFILSLFLFSSFAHASYFATHCSTADGSVKWETGHNSNTITFEYYSSEGKKTQSFSFYEAAVKSEETVVISDVRTHTCGMSSSTKIYVDTVAISAAPESAALASFLHENFGDSVKTQVFCKFHMNGRAPCPAELPEIEEKP